MNSVIAHKGFITFLIITGIVTTTLIGYNLILKTNSNRINASNGEFVVTEISTANISHNGSQIIWKTKNDSTGSIVYTDKPEFCEIDNQDTCIEEISAEESTEHIVNLTYLSPETKYYFKIKDKTGKYHPEGAPISFSTIKEDETADSKNNTYYIRKYTGPDYLGIIPEEISKILEMIGEEGNDNQDLENKSTDNDPGDVENGSEDNTKDTTTTGADKDFTDSEETNNEEGSNNGDTENVLGIESYNNEYVSKLISEEFYNALKYGDKNYDFNKDNVVDILDYPLFIHFITAKED